MSQTSLRLRPYNTSDEDEVVALWQRSWQAAYPQIDFAQRIDWFREHWSGLQADCRIIVAEFAQRPARLAGFVTVSPRTGYLDQIVVAPEAQRMKIGQLLMEAAKQIGSEGLTLHVNQDNARALAFYRRNGFEVAGEDVNSRSGAPVYMMTWRPDQPPPAR